MAREFNRADRIGEQVMREVAVALRTEMSDPRLNLVTVSTVQMSRDMAHATVLFTVLNGDDERRTQVAKILNGAAGFIRHVLGQRMRLRVIPQLHFRFDDVPERGAHLSALIDSAVAADRHVDQVQTADRDPKDNDSGE